MNYFLSQNCSLSLLKIIQKGKLSKKAHEIRSRVAEMTWLFKIIYSDAKHAFVVEWHVRYLIDNWIFPTLTYQSISKAGLRE